MKSHFFFFTELRKQGVFGKLLLAVILVLSGIAHVSAQGNDSTPPEVIDFSFTPSTVDTTDSSQTVTVTIRATDDVRGVSSITVHFQSLILGYQGVKFFINSSHRISGDNKDGVYRATAIFRQYIKAGAWQVSEIETFDGINRKTLSVLNLAERGFPTQLQVISGNEDVSGPEISDFSFTPSAIDVTNSSQSITVTVRATDAKAGVSSISVGFLRPNDDMLYSVSMNSNNRISGDDKDGVYRRVYTFSGNTTSGIYGASVYVSDTLGNPRFLQSPELAERGYVSQLQVTRLAPTVYVSISGRVLTTNNRGASKARVTLAESNGSVRYAITNPFGYYRFAQVKVGDNYTLKVKHKGYSFTPQVYFIDSARTNLDFTANP